VNRRRFCGAATGTLAGIPLSISSFQGRACAMSTIADATVSTNAVRPFPPVNYSDAELADLRRRIAATRWPARELVPDQSQGVQLAMAQALAQYWSTDYDWRKCEARLNAIPQFVTEIDGQQIHFIHVRSKDANALPLIVTHGWPGSIIEQLKIIEPLTSPPRTARIQTTHFTS